jgi:hypothetical protein
MPKDGIIYNPARFQLLNGVLTAACVVVVVTVTVKFAAVPAETFRVEGETEQLEYCGAPEHARLALPEKPLPAARLRL